MLWLPPWCLHEAQLLARKVELIERFANFVKASAFSFDPGNIKAPLFVLPSSPTAGATPVQMLVETKVLVA